VSFGQKRSPDPVVHADLRYDSADAFVVQMLLSVGLHRRHLLGPRP